MKFQVQNVEKDFLKVVYADGSWAHVPIVKGQEKRTVFDNISAFQPKPSFDTTGDVPYAVGEEGDTDNPVPFEDPIAQDGVWDYISTRGMLYPSVESQADAQYWAREGNTARQAEIDKHIKWIKDNVPIDKDKEYTLPEREELFKNMQTEFGDDYLQSVKNF